MQLKEPPFVSGTFFALSFLAILPQSPTPFNKISEPPMYFSLTTANRNRSTIRFAHQPMHLAGINVKVNTFDSVNTAEMLIDPRQFKKRRLCAAFILHITITGLLL